MYSIPADLDKFRRIWKRVDDSEAIFQCGLLVLVVDDCKIVAKATASILSGLGCHVHLAHDGDQGVRACLERAFSCVLMDYVMPTMDGLEATALIRLADKRRNVYTPIIGHSASADGKTLVAAGMDDFIRKPASGDVLREKLALWCGPRVA